METTKYQNECVEKRKARMKWEQCSPKSEKGYLSSTFYSKSIIPHRQIHNPNYNRNIPHLLSPLTNSLTHSAHYNSQALLCLGVLEYTLKGLSI